MARNQRKYNTEYKVQAVKLSNEIGSSKAAVELGIPIDTLYGWVKAAKEGRLDIGGGAHTPQTAMSLAEELNTLRKQVKQQEKEIRRLKEENEFLAEASAFSPPAVGSQQRAANEIHRPKNRRRQEERKNYILLQNAGCKPARVLSVSGAQKSTVEIPATCRNHAGN